jgi:hypothetical protein
MASETLLKILDEVKTLPREEQEELRKVLEGWLGEQATSTVQQEVQRQLFEDGLLTEIRPRWPDSARHRAWKPIETKGKPLSEVIIEERG